MIKKLLLLLVTLLSGTFCLAGGVKVKEGKTSFLNEKANAMVVFDFSTTTWEDDDDFKKWCGKDYDIRIKKSKMGFITGFNENSRFMKISEGGNTKYSIIIKVNNFIQKCPGIPCYLRIYGTISIVDNATSETVCKLVIDGLKGRADYTPDDRFYKCFKKLAETLIKQFSK